MTRHSRSSPIGSKTTSGKVRTYHPSGLKTPMELNAIMQNIRSYESEVMQLTDFLLGAVSYNARSLSTSVAKRELVKRLEDVYGVDLGLGNPLEFEDKFSVVNFNPEDLSR